MSIGTRDHFEGANAFGYQHPAWWQRAIGGVPEK
jgi:hypothetical protein